MPTLKSEPQDGLDPRKKYETPSLVLFGTVAELTRKTGGPGNDNPGHRMSV